MWKTVKFDDVCDVRRGTTITKKQTIDGKVPVIGGGTKPTYYHNKANREANCITISGSGASAGYVNMWDMPIFASDCSTVEPKDESQNGKFLYYYLCSQQAYIHANFRSGAAQPHVYAKDIATLEYPIVSLAEQQRIVAKLDAAFAEIDTAITATKDSSSNIINTLTQALADVFFIKGKDWEKSKVGDVAEHCLGKMLDKNKNKGNYQPYLRNLNVRWFQVNTDDMLTMKIEKHEHDRYSVLKGDLLICEGGYPGRASVWEYDEPAYIQKALHRVRFKNSIFNKWLMYYLYVLDDSEMLKKHFTGSGIQHFTGKSLDKLIVPMAPISKTNEFIKMFESLRAEVMNLNDIYNKKVFQLELLKSAILAQELQSEAA